jgi:L-amino acid N-acyltransferase YncA
MNFTVEEMKAADWSQFSAIFSEGIETGMATFLSDVPGWEEWDREHCDSCRLAARCGDTVLGWAALAPVSSRCVYTGIAEASIYIGKASRGQGVGTALLTELIRCSELDGYYSIQAEIIRENTPSRELFKRCGFREIGIRERFGQMQDGQWHDVVLLERRSKTVG